MRTHPLCAVGATVILACGSLSYDADAGPPMDDASVPPDAGDLGSAVRMAEHAPPPASSGTLLVSADGRLAIASDADTHRIVVVDLEAGSVLHTIPLDEGDEPGQLVEDGSGRVHVALRRAGDLVTIDPTSGAILARRPVCGAPRGLAFDASTDLVHVACATGELVSFPGAGGPPTRSIFVEPDLRDVVVAWEGLVVSTFRAAELVVVASDGTVARRLTLPTPEFRTVTRDLDEIEVALLPRVAWRMVAHGSDVFVLHQRSVAHVPVFDVAGGSYSGPGGCTAGVVESVITRIRGAGSTVAASIAPALVTDLAVSADGSTLWLSSSTTRTTSTLHSLATNRVDAGPEVPCIEPVSYETADRESLIGTQRISIAILPDGTPVSQVRLPNAVEIGVTGARIAFGADGEADTGHALFHLTTPVGLACASCHPEAGEDGHTWTFGSPDVPLLRRTQSLRGGLVSTAPFHWAGEHADLTSIMREGFTRRMNGRDLSVDEVAALAHWLDAIPATTGLATDPATLERGRALFEGTSAGCTTCHSGEQLTDSRTLNVGTGGAFQVPTLRGVGSRAPFFHDGRASSVVATIDGTQARAHGGASSLAPSDLADLVAYVESL